jgi:hypothetical protein
MASWLILAVSLPSQAAAPAGGWTRQTLPNVGATAFGSSLEDISCTSPTSCVAVGDVRRRPVESVPLAERWNGLRWTIEQTASPTGASYGELDGVSCTSRRACIAVGSYVNRAGNTVTLAERWNGSSWRIQATPNPLDAWSPIRASATGPVLNGVSCDSPTTCVAVGEYSIRSSGQLLTLVERWNGGRWTIASTPQPRGHPPLGVTCFSANRCIAVGSGYPGWQSSPLVERWNGAVWVIQRAAKETVSGSSADSSLARVSCSSATACTAVGWTSTPGNEGRYWTLIERWDGTSWTTQQSPPAVTSAHRDSGLYGVTCRSATSCTAVGSYWPVTDEELPHTPLVEGWNGKRWAVQKTPAPDYPLSGDLAAVSCPSATSCFAVGATNDGTAYSVWAIAERSGP